MKKIFFLLPFFFVGTMAHAEMTLDQKVAALEKAVMASSVKQPLPQKFADADKQAQFDQNLQRAIAFLEKELQVLAPDYRPEKDEQLQGAEKVIIDNAVQTAIAEKEVALLVFLLEYSLDTMEEAKADALTREEQDAVYYAVYWLIKNGTNSQDYTRYTQYMTDAPRTDLSLQTVYQAMDAVFVTVAGIK